MQLEWRITLPGSILLLSMYDNPASLNNIDNLAMGVDTILTQHRNDTYIESVIIFTVLMGVTFNQSNVQCSSENLDSMSTIVFVNTSGIIAMIKILQLNCSFLHLVPLKPTGFNITREYFTMMDITAMFEWDLPPGSGPEAIVDNYTIAITPAPVSHPISNNVVLASPWNVTLNYNILYIPSITAINCAGSSEILILAAVEYSEYTCFLCNLF